MVLRKKGAGLRANTVVKSRAELVEPEDLMSDGSSQVGGKM